MAKKISERDIFQGDIFANARKSATEYIKMLEALQGELKEMLAINKKIVEQSASQIKTTDALKKRAKAIKEVTEASKSMEVVEREKVKTQRELTKLEADNERLLQTKNRTLIQNRKEEERLAKIKARNLKLQKQEGQAYSQMSKKLNELRNRYKNLAVQNKENTKEGRKLLKNIQQLDSKLKRVDKAVGQSQRNVGNYTSAWGKLGMRLKSVASAFGLVGGVMGAVQVIKGAFNIVKEFNQQLANLKAISGASPEELKELEKSARDLGATTRYTASEVAGLQIELSKLGFDPEQILQSTDAVLKMATATGTSLADASQIAGSTLRAFNLDASEMERVASTLAVSTSSSALNMEFLSTAMSKVAPVSSAMGFTIEETTALLGTLANAGFDASSSATATRNILLKMADSSGELAQALGRPVKNLDDLVPALRELQEGGIDISEALELTDKRSVSAFKTLLEGTQTISTLAGEITGAESKLNDMANTMEDTLEGDIARLNSAWSEMILGTADSTGAVDKLRGAIRYLTENLDQILSVVYNVIKGFIVFKTTQFIMTTGMQVARGVMIAYRFTMLALTKGVRTATASVKLFNTAVKSSPIGFLISALTTAIALLWDFGDEGEEAISKVDQAVNDLKSNFEEMKKAQEDFKKQLKLTSESNVANLKKELAQMKINGATSEEIAKKQFEIEQQGLRDHLQVKADVFRDYQKISSELIQTQKDLEAQRKFMIDKIVGVENVNTGELEYFQDMSDWQLGFFSQKFRILRSETEELRNQRKELDKKLRQLTREEEIIRTNLETKKIEKKLDGERQKTVAYYKELIKDINNKLQNNVTTRKQAIPLQKQIRDYQKEIDKILGKSNTKGRTGNDILKQRIAYETELLKLQRERRNLIENQETELLNFQANNVQDWIDDEIKLREEQAKSQEFVSQGDRVRTDEIKNLLDLRFEIQKEALEQELKLAQTIENEKNNDYINSVTKRIEDGKLTQKQGDDLIFAYRQKTLEQMALLELKYKIAVSDANDERVNDYAEAEQEILDLQNATIDQMSQNTVDAQAQEREVLKQRLTAFREFTNQIIQLMDKRTDAQIQAIDKELAVSEKREDELRRLAEKGTTTAEQSLASEQKRQAELERQKEELEKKKLRRQAILSGLDLLSSKIDNNETDAVSSTIRDITSLIAIIGNLPAFAEGSEFVERGNAPKGTDKILARVDEGERILTKDQNKRIGNISNEQLTSMAQHWDDVNWVQPKVQKLHEPFQSSSMILSKFDELQKTIENKPMLTEVRWDEVSQMIVEKVETKQRIENRHKSSKGIF